MGEPIIRNAGLSSLSRLFTPISIGTMEVKNRIAMAPMATDYAEANGLDAVFIFKRPVRDGS